MSTFVELQQRLLDHGFSDSKYRSYSKTWLNEGQRKLAAEVDMRMFFQAVQFDTSSFDSLLPSNYLRLIEANLSTDATNWTQLDSMTLRDFDDAPVTYGTPTSYTIAGTVFYLYPYPDSTVSLTIVYYRSPTEMAADDDEPELPDTYEDMLISWALKRAYEREQDFQAASYWANDFNTLLQNLQGQLQTDSLGSEAQIVPGMWAKMGGVIGPVLPR